MGGWEGASSAQGPWAVGRLLPPLPVFENVTQPDVCVCHGKERQRVEPSLCGPDQAVAWEVLRSDPERGDSLYGAAQVCEEMRTKRQEELPPQPTSASVSQNTEEQAEVRAVSKEFAKPEVFLHPYSLPGDSVWECCGSQVFSGSEVKPVPLSVSP